MANPVFLSQLKAVNDAFSFGPATMMMISKITGIDRANVCRHVATLRRADRIFFVRHGLCQFTKHPANYFTTDEAYRPHRDLQLF